MSSLPSWHCSSPFNVRNRQLKNGRNPLHFYCGSRMAQMTKTQKAVLDFLGVRYADNMDRAAASKIIGPILDVPANRKAWAKHRDENLAPPDPRHKQIFKFFKLRMPKEMPHGGKPKTSVKNYSVINRSKKIIVNGASLRHLTRSRKSNWRFLAS